MENEEIDLIEVMAKLWQRKRLIFSVVLCFLITGSVIAFVLPRKYTAECTLGLELEDKTTRISVEGMSAFQSTPLGDVKNTRIVSPTMYPDLFFSVPFQKELIYTPLYVSEKGDTVTFYRYLLNKTVFPETCSENISSSVERLSPEEKECLDYLKKNLSITVNSKENNLKIAVDMPDPRLAAMLADQAQQMLQRYITRLKITRAQAALDFIEERYVEVKKELEQKQQALVEFRERWKGQNSIQAEAKDKILTNDYELFFDLYADVVTSGIWNTFFCRSRKICRS